VDLDSI